MLYEYLYHTRIYKTDKLWIKTRFTSDDVNLKILNARRSISGARTLVSRHNDFDRSSRAQSTRPIMRKVKTDTYLRPKRQWCRHRETADRLARWVSASPNLSSRRPAATAAAALSHASDTLVRIDGGKASTMRFRRALINPTAIARFHL